MGNKQTKKKSPKYAWTQLNDPPPTVGPCGYGRIAQINTNEFMVATNTKKDIICGLYIFNIDRKEWRLWMEYPEDWELSGTQILFDKGSNALYLWHVFKGGGYHQLMKIHMETMNITHYTDGGIDGGMKEEHAINTKDEIHMIGGWKSNKHIKFDKITQEFHTVHHFDSFQRMYGTLIAHIPSKDVLLIFGGSTGNDKPDCHIREFCLKTSKWRKIEGYFMNFPYYFGYALLTRDEKHILLIPLFNKSFELDIIMILDILHDGKYHLRRSEVRLPPIGDGASNERWMALTGDGGNNILVYGFVKNVYKKMNNSMLPSNDIMDLISDFYGSEVLHLVRMPEKKSNKKEHFIISVSSVLN